MFRDRAGRRNAGDPGARSGRRDPGAGQPLFTQGNAVGFRALGQGRPIHVRLPQLVLRPAREIVVGGVRARGARGWHHISYSKMLTDSGGEIYETAKMRSAEISSYGFGLRDSSMIDVWDDHNDGVSMTIQTVFPNFVLQQLRNCLAVRTIVP